MLTILREVRFIQESLIATGGAVVKLYFHFFHSRDAICQRQIAKS